jgi:hypothetical protein
MIPFMCIQRIQMFSNGYLKLQCWSSWSDHILESFSCVDPTLHVLQGSEGHSSRLGTCLIYGRLALKLDEWPGT